MIVGLPPVEERRVHRFLRWIDGQRSDVLDPQMDDELLALARRMPDSPSRRTRRRRHESQQTQAPKPVMQPLPPTTISARDAAIFANAGCALVDGWLRIDGALGPRWLKVIP